jgi:hypothetical protein
MRKRFLITTVVAQSLLLGACHSSEVTLTPDAGSGGFDAAGPWGCLDQPPEVTTASPVTITFEMFDAIYPVTTAGPTGGSDLTVISFDPLSGVSIEACDPGDLLCSTPVTPIVTTEDAGVATLTVPGNFTGFFKFTAAGYLPSYTYQGNFLADASTLAPPAAMLAPADAITLAGSLGAIVDLDAGSSVGLVFFEVYDCFDRHGAGVQFALSTDAGPTTVPFYLADGLPSGTATETDSVGAAGAVNVPVGPMTITATLAATNQTLGSITVNVRAGGTTSGWVRARTH